MKLRAYGDRGLLIELADTAEAVACADLLLADPGVQELVADVVPGARTVLLRARSAAAVDGLRALVPGLAAGPGHPDVPTVSAPVVVVPVTYDGADLSEVARQTGLTADEVVAAHTETPWRVAFGGFAPGFAYLVGGDPRLRVPRRAAPRTAVPAGSVGLAGEFSGVYPRSSPGGWQLIGHTDLQLWDLDRDPPALLSAGALVRFEAVTG